MKTVSLRVLRLLPLAFLLSSCATEQHPPAIVGLTETNKPTTTQETVETSKSAMHVDVKTPRFLVADHYDAIAKSLPAFPSAGSVEQRADELTLLSLQQMRTKADCSRAASEVKTNLANFYGEPNGPLTAQQVKKLNPFFEEVRSDADFFLHKLKNERGRKRPFTYINGLEPCVARELTPAYPSGHATISRLYALILSDLYPADTKVLLKRSDVIANDRVLAGMHHRSDVVAGQALGERLYKEFEKSPDFKKELAELEHSAQRKN